MVENDTPEALALSTLCQRVTAALSLRPDLNNVWVTAETSDLRCHGGHCYMELIEKHDDGTPAAKCRAVIWSHTYKRLAPIFEAATGTPLRSDIKIMVRVSVNYHPVYGLSLVISDINPDYTVGDLVRRRNAIIAQLQRDGIYDLNKLLPWSKTPWRIAIISAANAAGYGDFIKQLHNNPYRLRFSTTLFAAAMQGERTAPSIIAALDAIMSNIENFDCVVIIRGGGAVADLAWFDDYDLASNVAQFPLPVIVGIGHERDINVLDYVANTSVKTPTAAAQFLIGRMADAYVNIVNLGNEILSTVKNILSAHKEQLAYCQGNLPAIATNVVTRNRQRLINAATITAGNAKAMTQRQHQRLDNIAEMTNTLSSNIIRRHQQRLTAIADMLEVLSPEATLRRGYTITRVDGHAVTDSTTIEPGSTITTQFATGPAITSTIKKTRTRKSDD